VAAPRGPRDRSRRWRPQWRGCNPESAGSPASRARPDGPALALLRIAVRHPRILRLPDPNASTMIVNELSLRRSRGGSDRMPTEGRIVEGAHAAREAIAKKSDHDLDQIIDAARARQAVEGRRVVRLPPKSLPASPSRVTSRPSSHSGLRQDYRVQLGPGSASGKRRVSTGWVPGATGYAWSTSVMRLR
jgi:hypothetical protein